MFIFFGLSFLLTCVIHHSVQYLIICLKSSYFMDSMINTIIPIENISDVELSHDQRDEGTINTTRASTTALDTLVHTACQDVNHHTTCSEMSVNSTVAVTTSSLLDSSVPSTASSISSSEHSLEENNAIMGTMLDSNMIAAVSQAVRGTGVNVLSLPTMAFKQIDTPSQSSEESYSIQDETMDSDSNEVCTCH